MLIDYLLIPIMIAVGTTVIINLLQAVYWIKGVRSWARPIPAKSTVAILVAARNEANNLPRCLDALLALDYPIKDLSIWVGNDSSEDNTLAIAQAYAAKHPHIHVLDVVSKLPGLEGKANVLAQLANASHSEYVFVTDADIAVPPAWVRQLIAILQQPGAGIVNGVTGVAGRKPWAVLQHIDWLFAISMLKTTADWGRPVTAIGNNMAITREAYEAIGGYEAIGFSVTEDYALFKAAQAKGYNTLQAYGPASLAYSEPVKHLNHWLLQRKRWMRGALQLPFFMKGLLFLQACFFPLILLLCAIQPLLGGVVWLVKIGSQATVILLAMRQVKQWRGLTWLWVYECYALLLSLLAVAYFYSSKGIVWKGRRYQ